MEAQRSKVTFPELSCPSLAELRWEPTSPESKGLFPPALLAFPFVVLPMSSSKIHHFDYSSVLSIITYIYKLY